MFGLFGSKKPALNKPVVSGSVVLVGDVLTETQINRTTQSIKSM